MKETHVKEWFASWFDSPFYHELYDNRDEVEAEKFIENLLSYLLNKKYLAPKSKLLDLACGKGRHALTMAKYDFEVLGVDLSPQSIQCASQNIPKNLDLLFDTHDMREVYVNRTFDAVFNLFTSFGYFEGESDNEKMLKSIHSMLESRGLLIIDFFNAHKVIKNLITSETITKKDTVFEITRKVSKTHVHKTIRVIPKIGNKTFDFREQVQLFNFDDFQRLLTSTQFNILATFGNLELDSFDPESSDRLIIVAQKVN